jgi:hypothetical protein
MMENLRLSYSHQRSFKLQEFGNPPFVLSGSSVPLPDLSCTVLSRISILQHRQTNGFAVYAVVNIHKDTVQ